MKILFGYAYTPSAYLKVTDEDAADFLQTQFSNDLRPFEAGQCTYGLWLDVKGKVIADSRVLCQEKTCFLVLSEHSLASVIKKKLEEHIIADDVIVEDKPPGAAIALVGFQAETLLDSMGFKVPADDITFTRFNGTYVFPGRRSLEPSFELWSNNASEIVDLQRQLTELGVEFISMEQMQLMRIASGIPRIPDEIGPADLPGEGELINDGVSLGKGCYLGQEVVARMHNIGRAQRALFKMKGSGVTPRCPLSLYNGESKSVGELRSAYLSEDGWIGVALLKTRFVEPGELLNYASGNVKVERLFGINKDKG